MIIKIRIIFKQSPLLLPFICIIIGIILVDTLHDLFGSMYGSVSGVVVALVVGALCFLSAGYVLWSASKALERRWPEIFKSFLRILSLPLVCIVFMVLSGYNYADTLDRYDKSSSQIIYDTMSDVIAIVVDMPFGDNHNYRYNRVKTHVVIDHQYLAHQSIDSSYANTFANNAQTPSYHVALLNIDTLVGICKDDVIKFRARPRSLPDTKYGQWLVREGYVCQLYAYQWSIDTICRATYKMDDVNFGKQAKSMIENLRCAAFSRLNTADSSGLTSSLLLGHRRQMSQDLRNAYSQTGVAHVLAISGMHVGIIFSILTFIFGWIKLFDRGQKYLAVLIILTLVMYLLFVGFSVSAMRAVIMFGVFQIAIILNRQSNSLNSLSLAGIIILALWPSSLFDLGFQLSFIAVLSILFFYPVLLRLVSVKGRFINGFYKLFAITISAQIGVLPLIVYNFGMAPVCGLFLFPLLAFSVPLIIIAGVLYLLTDLDALGIVLGNVCEAQNFIIRLFERIDNKYSNFLGFIDINLQCVVAIYLLLLLLILVMPVMSDDNSSKDSHSLP